VIEIEEAAFTLKVTPRKIARASHFGFIHQTLAAPGFGQAAMENRHLCRRASVRRWGWVVAEYD